MSAAVGTPLRSSTAIEAIASLSQLLSQPSHPLHRLRFHTVTDNDGHTDEQYEADVDTLLSAVQAAVDVGHVEAAPVKLIAPSKVSYFMFLRLSKSIKPLAERSGLSIDFEVVLSQQKDLGLSVTGESAIPESRKWADTLASNAIINFTNGPDSRSRMQLIRTPASNLECGTHALRESLRAQYNIELQ